MISIKNSKCPEERGHIMYRGKDGRILVSSKIIQTRGQVNDLLSTEI